MSTNKTSTIEQSDEPRRARFARVDGRANWSTVNTAGMVIGFILFWPAGLAILLWILSGREVRDLPAALRELWSSATRLWSTGRQYRPGTGNDVFDSYQRTQYDRIREIRDEMVARAKRFGEFRASKQRRADEEEFERFMASAPEQEAR